MGPPPGVLEEPSVVALGEYRGCFDNDCRRPPVAVAVFGFPSAVGDWLCPTVLRFCAEHEHDAWVLTHSWDSDVTAWKVEDWDRPGGVRDALFPEGLDDAVSATGRLA